MITDRNQVCFAKMVGCGLQEEVIAGIEKSGRVPWKKRMVKTYFLAPFFPGIICLPYQ